MEPIGDFELLEYAADKLQNFFQFDEEQDLRASVKNVPLSDDFLYWPDPYKSNWEPQFQSAEYSPFPAAIHSDFSQVESASFMGILPELGRAWVSVDNRLYLWDYNNRGSYTLYNGLSDVIVSVALASPKPGIFTDVVKYVLVVATTVEVVLLAVTWRSSSDGVNKELKLQNTQYTISTDNSTIFKIVCSVKGRIFLAGNDRNLYELVYEADEDSWKSMLGLDAPYKCKKVSHSTWSLINILDPVFRVFGGAEDGLVDLIVDDARGILYGVSANGNLSLFHLGHDGNSAISTTSGFDIISHVQEYLISRSSVSRSSGIIDPANLRVASLHVVDPTEASNVHLIVTMSSGARVYVCINTSHGIPVANAIDVPKSIQIINIRTPPSTRKLNEFIGRGGEIKLVEADVSVPICAAFYSHGVDVYASSQLLGSGGDMIVGIGPDFIIRRSGHALSSESLRSLTESMCVVECDPQPRRIYDIRETCPQLSDPSLSALRALYVCSASLPGVGASSASSGSSVAAYQWGFSSGVDQPAMPVGPPAALPCASWEKTDLKCGLSRDDVDSGVVASLNEMALQHGPLGAYPQRRINCLSNTGMHTIVKMRPVDYLFRMLSRSSSSNFRTDFPVDYLADVGSFFEQYGAVNACCMCFGLACGLPADAGGDIKSLQDTTLSVSIGLSTLQRRAISAILRYSDTPSYNGGGAQSSGNQQVNGRQGVLLSGASHIADPRVVPGVSPVSFSACHNGLYLMTSRLLRPLWSKKLVGSKIVGKTDTGVDKKEYYFLLRRQELGVLLRPILHLVRVLREYFGPTLANAEAVHNSSVSQALSGDEVKRTSAEPGSLVSKQLSLLEAAGKFGSDGSSTRKHEAKPQDSHEVFAKKQEDSSIFRCYRLLCRAAQALNLLDILLSAKEQYGAAVPWNMMSGFNFCSLVTSSSAQIQAKAVAQAVISRVSPGATDPLVMLIDTNCFMYFSIGDRLAFEASKLLDRALDVPDDGGDDPERKNLISRSIHMLLQACVYWRSQDCVQASGSSTALANFCARLRLLGSVECFDGIVDLTLTTADNFRATDAATFSNNDTVVSSKAVTFRSHVGDGFGGDRGLYHGGASPVRTESERELFRSSCYEILLQCIKELLSSENDALGSGIRPSSMSSEGGSVALGIVFRMITRAAACSDDAKFHTKLYSCLLGENRDMLVRVESPFIENYLLEQDPNLTYSYYTFHGMYTKAAQLMDVRAHVQGGELQLSDRIDDLNRAVSSAQRAVAACREAGLSTVSAVQMLGELEEKLDIAELQRLILTALSSKLQLIGGLSETQLTQEESSSLKCLEDIVSRLSNQLWSVSELYNQVTEPYELWDLSLIILHSCKHDDPQLILKLWTSVIYSAVPMKSDIPAVQQFLVEKRKFLMRPKRGLDREGSALFEDIPLTWLHELQNSVVDLGVRLSRAGSATGAIGGAEGGSLHDSLGRECTNPAFPLAFLVEELEAIAALLLSVLDRGSHTEQHVHLERAWVAKCMLRVGTSRMALIDAYASVLESSQGKSDEKKLQLLSSASSALLEWTKLAAGYSASKSSEARQLLDSARSGKFRIWSGKFMQNLSALIGSTRLLRDGSSSDSLRCVIEDIRSDIAEADHRVKAYLLG